MGEFLKSKYPVVSIRCRECGKSEGDDGDSFFHTLDEIMDLSEDEKQACEWFSERMEYETFSDILQIGHDELREEMIHIFILENLVEKLLARKPICETCFARKRDEKTLS